MKEKRKLKLKKFYLHPITIFMLLTLFTVILSGIFSVLGIQASYSTINSSNNQLENVLVTVENLFSYDGLKYIISNATPAKAATTPAIGFRPTALKRIAPKGIKIV